MGDKKRAKTHNGRSVGQLCNQINHKRRRLVRDGKACWIMRYYSLEHELEKLEGI
jgi:hypothetical protein